MPLSNSQVTVTTSPTLLVAGETNPVLVHLHLHDNTDNVYIGNSTVTTSTGLRLDKQDSFEITLAPGNSLYAIITTSTATVSVIKQVL
jgi:hypothetical protein